MDSRTIRCAIYTRVSTDSGLDQEFNSLDAQYDASQAYIRSQAHAGWTLIKPRYDDGGFSGGSTDRPALQQLLADVEARRVNIIVVYKVDRLTRSLADFAKLVELFDAHGVSFVSVTQQFNTTTSMGRLTLNVLLSFAQFEREVTSERIRDKVAASKRKGLWVGGMVPLGYELNQGKLTLHKTEAETVRLIFRRYLEIGSVNQLVKDLRVRGLVSRVRRLSTGRTSGGVAFTQGPLFYILRNRFYVGEVAFKGEILLGPQPPLMDRALFDAVQALLTAQRAHRTTVRFKSRALLSGLLFDDAGQRMIATHATKNSVRYRYYVSAPCLRGPTDEPVGSVTRVPANDIELAVANALIADLNVEARTSDLATFSRDEIEAIVAKIEVRKNQFALYVKTDLDQRRDQSVSADETGQPSPSEARVLVIPWKKATPAKTILRPAEARAGRVRSIKPAQRSSLIRSIGLGRQWLQQIIDRSATVTILAEEHDCTVRQVNMTISLAFLAPSLVTAAVEGGLPRGVSVTSLRDAPPEWSQQVNRLGLAPITPR